MKTKINLIIIYFIVLAGIFMHSKCSYAVPPLKNPSPSDYSTTLTYDEAKKLNKPIVLYFYVNWCHYCKKFTPILNRARENYDSDFSFVFINCDNRENSSIVNQFRVRAYPTVYVVDKDERAHLNNSGLGSYEAFSQELDKFVK